ncbi:M23 family metallopeptidase [Nocardioides bizhenqiangii]|uniref:M23 family metallopeptidase n=1 Tax=Nocardioides bizhenqiangii TaxID=3095076 RepID=A0ABZ0ZJC6_9ACTN|nr:MULTISPECIES: M23 family metallopeptidase [unclassified Nocardioides]MDZ5620233.1 M23 family metallopeptidase [Nocardioides sp. HM23]WQQ24609.1 M23 family metallopeptidase [Nocardioides sp. HM61]
MSKSTVRRVRQAVTAPALIGAIACSGLLPDATATGPSPAPARLVTAAAVPTQPVRIVPGLVVRPEPDAHVLPLQGYRLTATFGDAGSLWSSDHTGLDFAAPEGTPLVAVGAGVVSEVGYDGSYGNKTVVTLEDGTELWYCHQSSQAVAVGERVAAGDVIGALGSTGNSTGPHLHLEVRVDGEPIDPEAALADWGVRP